MAVKRVVCRAILAAAVVWALIIFWDESCYLPIGQIYCKISLTDDEIKFLESSHLTGETVYRETVLPIRNDIQLLRSIGTIIAVENVTNGTVYQESDYSVSSGLFHISANSEIRLLSPDWINTIDTESQFASKSLRKDGSGIRIQQDYVENQIQITYNPKNLLSPLAKAELLPKLTRLISKRSWVTITFVGDSITVGSDSSKVLGIPPYQKPWPELVTGYLALINPNVRYRNIATGGMTAAYGANLSFTDLHHATDVLVIAYGMNDQSGNMSKNEFKGYYRKMIETAKKHNRNVEFIFVCGWRPESTWQYSNAWRMDEYREAAIELAKDLTNRGNHAVVVDVMSETDRILTRKIFGDITSNGVNHPNDFLQVLYAQTILHKLGFVKQETKPWWHSLSGIVRYVKNKTLRFFNRSINEKHLCN